MSTHADVTEAELAVLKLLWKDGETTVRELTDELYPDGGASHYGTVQKLLQRLVDKGWVERTRASVPHAYSAVVEHQTLVDLRLEAIVDQLCSGSVTPLLTHLAQRRRLNAKERRELRDFVDQLEAKKKGKQS